MRRSVEGRAADLYREHGPDPDEECGDPWEVARREFPYGNFPYRTLPDPVTSSLLGLAESCATSPTSLPGFAMAILASLVGRTANVRVKSSWNEPLIFWCADIRPSGSGKTPAARLMCKPLEESQRKVDEAYRDAVAAEQAKKTQDRKPVPRARSFYLTDLTIEGVRAELDAHPHGGILCIMDELSAFIGSQNEYKGGRGSDRESWLKFWEGLDARAARSGETVSVRGARVNLCGGIQPKVWASVFKSNNGIFLADGTVFRFLPTIEPQAFIPLTDAPWNGSDRARWESILARGMEWANGADAELAMEMTPEARTRFIAFANDIRRILPELPEEIGGFIPKLISYAARFSGVLKLLDHFNAGEEVSRDIDVDLVERGTAIARFYAGHIVRAMESLCMGTCDLPDTTSPEAVRLAETLETLRDRVQNGRLSVGCIFDEFNRDVPSEREITSQKAMGGIIRRCGLSILPGRLRFENQGGRKCMAWDEKTERFLKESHQRHQCHPSQE